MKRQLFNRFIASGNFGLNSLKMFFFTILLCGIGSAAFATITVTPATNGVGICSNTAANGSAPAFTTLTPAIVFTEGAAGDFGGTTGTWTVTASIAPPTGWVYSAVAPTLSFTTGANIISVTQAFFNANIYAFTIIGSNNTAIDAVTITGLQVQASTTTSANGNLTVNVFQGTATGMSGLNAGNLSLNPQPIAGGTTVCATATTLLSDATAGGA